MQRSMCIIHTWYSIVHTSLCSKRWRLSISEFWSSVVFIKIHATAPRKCFCWHIGNLHKLMQCIHVYFDIDIVLSVKYSTQSLTECNSISRNVRYAALRCANFFNNTQTSVLKMLWRRQGNICISSMNAHIQEVKVLKKILKNFF